MLSICCPLKSLREKPSTHSMQWQKIRMHCKQMDEQRWSRNKSSKGDRAACFKRRQYNAVGVSATFETTHTWQ